MYVAFCMQWSSLPYYHTFISVFLKIHPGTSSFDMITTSVTAPAMEDSDGVADFLPDLSDRMSEFDNNNIDAEDNFDALGMMETLPAAKANVKESVKDGKDGVKSDTPDEHTAHLGDTKSGESESKTSAEKSVDEHRESKPEPKTDAETETEAERTHPASPLSPPSVLRNRKTHTDVTPTGSAASDSRVGNSHVYSREGSEIHSGHHYAGCCSGHTEHNNTNVGTHNTKISCNSAGSSSSSSSRSVKSTTTDTAANSPFSKDDEVVEEEDSNDASEVNEDRIHLAQQRLAQNLQQVSISCKCVLTSMVSNPPF